MRGTKIGLGAAAAALVALPALASIPAPEAKSPSILSELQVSPAVVADLKARPGSPHGEAFVSENGVVVAAGKPKFVDVNQGPTFVSSAKGSFYDSNKAKPGFKSPSAVKPDVKGTFQKFRR